MRLLTKKSRVGVLALNNVIEFILLQQCLVTAQSLYLYNTSNFNEAFSLMVSESDLTAKTNQLSSYQGS